MRYWPSSCDLLVCDRPTGLFQSGVPYNTSIIWYLWFYLPLHLLSLPESRMGGPWCRLTLPQLTPCWLCWISQMISWSRLIAFGTLLLDLGCDNFRDPYCNTSLKWGGWYTSSCTCISHDLLWNTCPNFTRSSCSTCGTWRVGMIWWSRGWIASSHFLNRFPHQWRSSSSIMQSTGWIWGNHAWTDKILCFLA